MANISSSNRLGGWRGKSRATASLHIYLTLSLASNRNRQMHITQAVKRFPSARNPASYDVMTAGPTYNDE